LFNLLRRNREDIQNFNHDLDNDVRHRVCWRYFRIGFEAFEEVLDPIEQIGKGFFTCSDVLGSLTDIEVENASLTNSRKRSYQEEDSDASRDDICWGEYL
jgi:CHAD domain-containing protein